MAKLFDIIKALQGAQGSIAKQAIMDSHKEDEVFKAYMKATYDTSINYYQAKVPAGPYYWGLDASDYPSGVFDFSDALLTVGQLANRVVTGNAATKHLHSLMCSLSPEGKELVTLLINRSIGASIGSTMVLKTWPNLFFSVPYMRCKGMDAKVKAHYAGLPCFVVQKKADGSFAYLSAEAATTRQGSQYPKWFVERMNDGIPDDVVLVGEMEVFDNRELMKRAEGNGVLNSVMKGESEEAFNQYQFVFTAWDSLSKIEYGQGSSDRGYEARFKVMMEVVKHCKSAIVPIECYIVASIAEANAIHLHHTSRGLEGTVWKTPNGKWRNSSSGTIDAVKNKVVFEADYEITGCYEGEGKASGMLGGLTIATPCRKITNNVGSGFTDKQRKELWSIREQLVGRIVAVEANDITTSRSKDTLSLSLPIVVEVREDHDKQEADTLERVYEQFEAAKEGRISA